MIPNASIDKTKSGRSATSCLECQRRKQKCSREWPCNHCQARKVPHLCQFASRKPQTADSSLANAPPKLSNKRKEETFASDLAAIEDDPDHGLSDGLARLGYMPGHDFYTLVQHGADSTNYNRNRNSQPAQSEDVEAALKVVLPKPYTDVLVQNYLGNANYQYYPLFPEQFRGQIAEWWDARAAGRRLTPELTCLLLRVCAVSAQFLEESLQQRLEIEIGEKAQSMTERFHAAAIKLSASIPRGSGGVIQVQQLFLEASWWKAESSMKNSWHSLSMAIREAQEIGMHKPAEGFPDFERELRKRMWCILWTWDWQMSCFLSRPLLIDQDDHLLEIPDGRLEGVDDHEIPGPLASVALQAQLGLYVFHLFQRMGTDKSVKLVLDTEEALEKWMGTFPAALRDHRPDTRWDEQYPYLVFMRCQLNSIAYSYLLAPLKPFLLNTADPEIMKTQLGIGLRLKGVDTCLDLMKACERFYDVIFPHNIKYFFIIFFMFDAATVICSAIAHDVDRTLPKRSECIRAIRTAQELMDSMADMSESARISAQLLMKLSATLPFTAAEKQLLGVEQQDAAAAAASKKIKTSPSLATASTPSTGAIPDEQEPPSYAVAVATQGYVPAPMHTAVGSHWQCVDCGNGLGAATTTTTSSGAGAGAMPSTTTAAVMPGMTDDGGAGLIALQPGDPLAGTYLDPLWDWDRLNMDWSAYSINLGL
ncbi:hypothetical protein BD289DRAFT_478550 [Coniella lustricola]|uniref:Zn(2)-C6 fungal-type domain-containing protein n=1 Tax=Coniella lustricola TaxID=2025994 RepID=A0A2T3ALV6_9PEZI|nr:hypothetical protein BD289DRAFT_478550 [Coniella lustricola]